MILYHLGMITNGGTIEKLASGRFRLKGRELHEGLQTNMHALSLRERVSYPTLWKYLTKSGEVNSFAADVLYAILVEGMGKTPEQVAEMRLGDVFEIIPDGAAE